MRGAHEAVAVSPKLRSHVVGHQVQNVRTPANDADLLLNTQLEKVTHACACYVR